MLPFLLKKLVAPLFFPLTLVLLLLGAGLALLWLTRRQRTGRLLVTAGAVLLALLSYKPSANMLLSPIEGSYRPLLDPAKLLPEPNAGEKPIRWIVVLGGGHNDDLRLPVTSRLSAPSLFRTVEGIRLHRIFPDSKLLFSGGGLFSGTTEARTMAELARSLGVKDGDIRLEERSLDTADQARRLKGMVKGDRFILVTSASHMLRAMALLLHQGLRPIAAPVGNRTYSNSGTVFNPGELYPSSRNLKTSETAFYEYLGIAWTWLRGQARY